MRKLTILHLLFASKTRAYRIKGSPDENKPFVPYEKGFVGNVHDPTTSQRAHVNQGYVTSVLLGDSVGRNRLFSCPQMVGPLDEKYYCRGKEYGYCDRRSGTCFCNHGYMGDFCESCAPSHFEIGGLCYPKVLCPNDCSNAGVCNYLTGRCECSKHREGEYCSKSRCSTFHEFCTRCNDYGCVECEEGFSVMPGAESGSQCEPCYRFDPRCRNCNSTVCTACVDLLLLSIHRSGQRPQDPPLPIDELTRELSVTVPFGSIQEDAFYDAEHYFLVDPALIPLKESAVECHYGLSLDDSISCVPYNMTSHIMCGNHGTITFDSPEYAVREDARHLRITLQRSGGGVGEASVAYSIYPITAGYEDVTPTAHYTTNQTVVFRHGQIRASFLVTINDDRMMERNETFSVHLSNPTPSGEVRLGTQQRTIVTIIDDDAHRTCSAKTTSGHSEMDLGQTEAGVPLKFTLAATSCFGEAQNSGGDTFKALARKLGAEQRDYRLKSPSTFGSFDDLGDGTYNGTINVTTTGHYELDVYLLVPGGLKGSYYTDSFLSDSRLDLVRTDAAVNFTFASGAITTFGRDFVSVRWEGYVVPLFSETYTFWLDIDEQARLWIDGVLLIDWWSYSPTSAMLHAEHDLKAFATHEIVIEYRDITDYAQARLLWSSQSTPLSVIPPARLLYKQLTGRYNFTVHPTSVDARKSVAVGEGLYWGVAGRELSFMITPNDEFGNFRGWPELSLVHDSRHLDEFLATAELIDSNVGYLQVPVNIAYDVTTRKFRASYSAITCGLYRLNVTILSEKSRNDPHHLFGSPFMVEIQPGATFAPQSIAYGGYGHCSSLISPCSGLYHGMAGKNSTFTLDAYDKHRNKRNSGDDEWSVTITGAFDDYHYGTVEDHLNGTYSISVVPIRAGSNELHIKLNGSPVRGSPFHMNVVPNQAVGASSFVLTDRLMTAMAENIIIVQLADEWGNFAIQDDNSAYFDIESQFIDDAKSSISQIEDGKYELKIKPLHSGHIDLSIKLNGFHIRGSPFNITVMPGMFSGEFSVAEGDGLRRATAGIPSSFVVQARDGGGNDKITDSASFDGYLTLTERLPTPVGLTRYEKDYYEEVKVHVNLTFINDGKYLATYTCHVSGLYRLHVRENGGSDIIGSPFNVTVGPAPSMSASHSIVTGSGTSVGEAGSVSQLRVYACDQFGNFVNNAVETIETSLTLKSRFRRDEIADVESDDPSKDHTKRRLARENGKGVFVLDYTPSLAGLYELNVTTFSPGGILGTYYSSPDFSPDYLLSKEISEIDKYWGACDDNIDCDLVASKPTIAGALWNGRLSADHNEEYKIGVECSHGGFASMAIDGSYIPWQSCSPSMATSYLMKANKAVDFSLRYRHEEGDAVFITLKWSSASIGPFVKIPSKNLFHKLVVGDTTTFYPNITHSHLYPAMSVAEGDALKTSISGEQHEFLVEGRDAWGNSVFVGGASVSAFSHHGPDKLETNTVDNEDGTYAIRFTPHMTGTHWLRVIMNGSDIRGSPFLMTVLPGNTDPKTSRLLIKTPIEGMIGKPLDLEMQASDAFENNRTDGGDSIRAILFVSPESNLPHKEYACPFKYTNHGVYSLACPAVRDAGDYILSVELRDSSNNMVHIKSSPYAVTIFPSSATPDTTEVTGGGTPVTFPSGRQSVNFTSSAGFFSSFVVTGKDKFANRVHLGGEHFVARIRGATNSAADDNLIMVIDQANGDYLFAYKVSYPSTYKIDVGMATNSGLVGEYYLSNCAFRDGAPDVTTVDDQINFSIKSLRKNTFFTNVRWTGFISFPHSDNFEIEVSGVDGQCKLWVGNQEILDTTARSRTTFSAVQGYLYDIKIEYSMDSARLFLTLKWSSSQLGVQIIPKSSLYNAIKPIRGSPFHLTVN
ncbi:hypothetical protein HJC23_001584 [Cyclotella cryptica]|uniref:PA14 domain-containing protein n=1 Tax=Cyclotella cryptica TaxID=29204 RepID=A0ABD3NWW1_9STRA|eukprot:CCRYP_020076-RA/>CCRYP_020076-RA protein AED:0.02 eAED:0.02 QI:1884/1/1/1/0.72/0.58/12/4120/1885